MTVFTGDELERLKKHGVVFFADRVIVEAQPPISEAHLRAVERQCGGPLPQQLIDLWRTTAGGELHYDLEVTMGGCVEAVSWVELFFHDSDHYRDLQGWIEHELELAEEAAKQRGTKWSGKLSHLPFGGFEYCDRVYAQVQPGPKQGTIVAWKQGLPPAWTYALHEDEVGTVAPDLVRAFGELLLDDDPEAPVTEYPSSEDTLRYLDELVEDGRIDRPLRDKVVAFYRRALVEWRTPLEKRQLSQHPRLMRAAMKQAIAKDDGALARQLAEQHAVPADAVHGHATAIEAALLGKAYRVAEALLAAGVKVPDSAFDAIGDDAVAPALIATLLDAGAVPTVEAIVGLAACGAPESAHVTARALARRATGWRPEFAAAKKKALAGLESSLAGVRAKTLGHYLGEAELEQRVARLRNFELEEEG